MMVAVVEGSQMEAAVEHLPKAAEEVVHHLVEGVGLHHTVVQTSSVLEERPAEVLHTLDRSLLLDSLRSRILIVLLEEAAEAAAAATEQHSRQALQRKRHSCHCPCFHSPMDVLKSRLDPEGHTRHDHGHFDHAAKEPLHR
jgi:hypothetical protein